MSDSQRLTRLQNESASDLSAVKAADCNSKGLTIIRILLATAPPPDSDAAFLPPQRTIFLLQAVQRWLTSDDADDPSDPLLAHLCDLSAQLAPLVQNIIGAHWDFMFDVTELCLEVGGLASLCEQANSR